VEDARPFALVATEGTAVTEFREKPGLPISGDINAGTYVLEPEALAGVPTDRPVSIEREVFPRLIAGGATVSAFTEEGYWRDLGTPQSYLQAHFDAMEGRIRGVTASAPHVAEEARVDLRAALGRWVSVGPGAVIEEGAEVEDSVVLRGATIGRGAKVTRTIVGPDAQIGAAAMVNDGVLGEGARIAEGTVADGPRVGPGADLRSPSG